MMKDTGFDAVYDMHSKVYYLYEKAPKKCRELEEIVSDLKECISIDEAGIKPIRMSGSRWISHKVKSNETQPVEHGAYTGHLLALSEDRSVKSTDRARFRAHYNKWLDAALVDILPIFSKAIRYPGCTN